MTARLVLVMIISTLRSATAQDGLEGVGHVLGRTDAPIQIVEFADYSCPFCAQFSRETMPLLRSEWIETGRASLRFIGFHNSYYKPGRDAARAAECAAEQDAFWVMHDLIFERQRGWLSSGGQDERFESWAGELGLDLEAFRDCWDRNPAKDLLDDNAKVAREHGVRATPTFLIGGRKVEGALTYEELHRLLDDQSINDSSTHRSLAGGVPLPSSRPSGYARS